MQSPLIFLIKELVALGIFLQDHSSEQVKEELEGLEKVRCTPTLSSLKVARNYLMWAHTHPTGRICVKSRRFGQSQAADLLPWPEG